jgi:uncharacterized membrane protein YhaH (DUF805 family)
MEGKIKMKKNLIYTIVFAVVMIIFAMLQNIFGISLKTSIVVLIGLFILSTIIIELKI